jgi:lysyl-tRNA synthetase class 2
MVPGRGPLRPAHGGLRGPAGAGGGDGRAREFAFRDRTADPLAELERITVAEAFQRFARIDLLATVSRDGATDRDALATTAATLGIRVAADDTWADVFSRVIVERIEPGLGLGQPTILYEYPTPEAALARPAGRDPRVAERFELYVCGWSWPTRSES